MGQRSQIYVRIHNEDAPAASEMKEYLIVNYYQWNFADRMVSRLRNFVERMEAETYFIMDEEHYQKFANFLDYNPDIKDMVLHTDVIEEALMYSGGTYQEQVDDVFNHQDNNDGQCYIDIDVSKDSIAYALAKQGKDEPMSIAKYLTWELGESWRKYYQERNDLKTLNFTQDNIAYIKAHARLMTAQELHEFKTHDYSQQFAEYSTPALEASRLRRELENRDLKAVLKELYAKGDSLETVNKEILNTMREVTNAVKAERAAGR